MTDIHKDKKPKSPLKIAHFIGSLHVGGAENQVALLVNSFSARGHKCHVIVMRAADGYAKELRDGVGLYNLNYRTRNAPLGLFRLFKFLRENRIEVLHCHMYHASVKAAIVAKLAGVKVVVTSEHGKNTWKSWRHHIAEKLLVNPFVNKRIAVSEDIRQIRIKEDGVKPHNIIVMPNSVNTQVKVSDNNGDVIKIGSLGRLVDAKDFPVLIHAIKKLIDQHYEVSLTIAGEGEERVVLERLVEQLGLSENVKLPGIKSAQTFLESIDLFVMSSKYEGVPVSLLEAMAHGLPIASTNVGGIPEIVTNNQEALLCDPGNHDALCDIMKLIINDQELRTRLGKAARKKVVECYSENSVIDKWEVLYSDLYKGSV